MFGGNGTEKHEYVPQKIHTGNNLKANCQMNTTQHETPASTHTQQHQHTCTGHFPLSNGGVSSWVGFVFCGNQLKLVGGEDNKQPLTCQKKTSPQRWVAKRIQPSLLFSIYYFFFLKIKGPHRLPW